jgi:hypothetical protein
MRALLWPNLALPPPVENFEEHLNLLSPTSLVALGSKMNFSVTSRFWSGVVLASLMLMNTSCSVRVKT